MKMNIKGLVFVGFAAAVFASAANAANDKTVTSKTYVDTKYVAGTGITVTPNADTGKNVIALDSTLDTTEYTAGDNISIENHEISADVGVKGIKAHGASQNLTMDANGVVELPAEQTVNDGTLSIQVGNNQAQTFTANTAGNTTVNLGAAAGKAVDTAITDQNATSTNLPTTQAVYDYVADATGTLYTAETGSLITVDNDNHTIGTTAEANVLEGVQVAGTDQPIANKKVNLGAAAGKAVDTAISDQNATSTNLPTTQAVYDYVADATGTLYTAETGSLITVDNNNHTIGTTAEANVLEGVQVAGTDQPITNKKVNLGAAAGLGTATTISSSSTNNDAATALAVYNFLNNGAGTANCSDTNPCAFVLGSGAPEWKPIQQ